ncbi:hypothetical protein, partial [Burkholderia sp. Ac-20353]|uniref:hypothetical protein n=1 Tax=Burkholderia sp. Ac-20353 TaxID=2703894 RepID=UPI00197B205C
VLCGAAAAFARLHGPIANAAGPIHTIPTHAEPAGARTVAVDESNVAPSLNDGKTRRQAPATEVSTVSSTVALGEAKAGWAVLFNH